MSTMSIETRTAHNNRTLCCHRAVANIKRLTYIWLLATLCVLVGPSSALHAQDADEGFTPAAYLEALHAAIDRLDAEPSVATVREVQADLAPFTTLHVNQEEEITMVPVLGAIGDPLPTSAIAQERITIVIRQLQAMQHDQTDTQLVLLEEIFARPAFVRADTLWSRVWRWLRQFLPEISTSEGAASPLLANGLTLIGWVVVGIGALVLVYLLSYWLQRLFGAFVGGNRRTSDNNFDEPRSAAEARQQAQRLASDGSYREAVRRMYLSALLTLDESDLVRYERSSTNREVLATLQANQPLYQQLRQIVDIFDDVWYGIHEPDRATYEHYVEAVHQLPIDAVSADTATSASNRSAATRSRNRSTAEKQP